MNSQNILNAHDAHDNKYRLLLLPWHGRLLMMALNSFLDTNVTGIFFQDKSYEDTHSDCSVCISAERSRICSECVLILLVVI